MSAVQFWSFTPLSLNSYILLISTVNYLKYSLAEPIMTNVEKPKKLNINSLPKNEEPFSLVFYFYLYLSPDTLFTHCSINTHHLVNVSNINRF